ncbi:uncharacterized protein CRV24_010495 [Beauveria bassiana]|nr:uncharacterized protein CRV24_010495 [Beauveria bassiana]
MEQHTVVLAASLHNNPSPNRFVAQTNRNTMLILFSAMMIRTTAINLLAVLAAAVRAQAVASSGYMVHNDYTRTMLPSSASAIDNAHHIFNQLNSAGRQWGSSLAHNGVGFFPAIVPAGTLLYHGDHTDQPPTHPEWLAFDVEHAELFAVSRLRSSGTTRRVQGGLTNQAPAQKPVLIGAPSHHRGDAAEDSSHGHPAGPASVPECPSGGCRNIRGYFHTYQASRDLRVLYLDGMAAAKTTMGTLDSQDLVLCEDKIGNLSDSFPFGEDKRASMICEMLTDWGYDGFVRMEGGFELVYCDFSAGVSFLSARRTFYPQDKLSDEGQQIFEVFRAAAEHYDGIGAERLRIDFSSMVSGWLFPINLTNADPDRPELPRFSSVKQPELRAIKSQVSHAYMIVKRFSRRFILLTSPNCSLYNFIEEIESATLTYVDAPRRPGDTSSLPAVDSPIDRGEVSITEEVLQCTEHFLLPSTKLRDLWETEDKLIHLAIETVTRDICTVLFSVRAALLKASPDTKSGGFRINTANSTEELRDAVKKGRHELRRLTKKLGWSEMKKISPCLPDEIMFAAMWPIGNDEDHFNPGCVKMNDLNFTRQRYWKFPLRK